MWQHFNFLLAALPNYITYMFLKLASVSCSQLGHYLPFVINPCCIAHQKHRRKPKKSIGTIALEDALIDLG